jgi:hypothetical protein
MAAIIALARPPTWDSASGEKLLDGSVSRSSVKAYLRTTAVATRHSSSTAVAEAVVSPGERVRT